MTPPPPRPPSERAEEDGEANLGELLPWGRSRRGDEVGGRGSEIREAGMASPPPPSPPRVEELPEGMVPARIRPRVTQPGRAMPDAERAAVALCDVGLSGGKGWS